jgi:hypothetical protein
MSLYFEEGLAVIAKAFEKREEDKAWQMWLVKYQHMDKNNFVPFTDFLKKSIRPSINKPNKTTEELIQMAEEIKKHDTEHSKK